MYKYIDISEALKLENPCFVDVRSPSEFVREHVAGAINIPLFNDAERQIVGALYNKEGKDKATKEGLKIASAKLPELVNTIESLTEGKDAVLYCWRGGMRSKALSLILELMEIPSYRLMGGYKAYRRFIFRQLQKYEIKGKLVVLHGLTGVGKTRLLHMLEESGYPTLDLEGLAGHRGSVFGHIATSGQSTQKNFDAMLYNELQRLSSHPLWVIEGEGKKIGKVELPPFLVESMEKGYHILLEAPIKNRSIRLLEEYAPLEDEEKLEVLSSLKSLEKRIGPKKMAEMEKNFRDNTLNVFVEDLCRYYYDLLYDDAKRKKNNFDAIIDASYLYTAAENIIAFLQNNHHHNNNKEEIK